MIQEVSGIRANTCLFREKLLVCAVASALGGAGSVRADDFEPNKWPPKAQKIIKDGVTATIPKDKTVETKYDDEGEKNIVVQGGELINLGVIDAGPSIEPSGLSDKPFYMIDARTSNSKVDNEGTINVSGDNSRGMYFGAPDGTIKNKGTISVTNPKAIGVEVKSGTFNNSGAINGSGVLIQFDGDFTGDTPKLLFEPDSTIESRTASDEQIKNAAKTARQIMSTANSAADKIVKAVQHYVANSGKITGKPPEQIKKTSAEAQSVTAQYIMSTAQTAAQDIMNAVKNDPQQIRDTAASAAGNIKSTANIAAQQIKALTGKSQQIREAAQTAADKIRSLAVNAVREIKGTTVADPRHIIIRGVSGGVYPIHLQGGTFSGRLTAEGETDSLYIENTKTRQASVPIEITGDIEGLETIIIKSSDWTITGNVIGTTAFNAEAGVDHVMVAGTAATPVQAIANIRFVTEPGKALAITADAKKPVKRLQLVDGGVLGTVSGVDTLQVAGDAWQANAWLTDIKKLEADGRINSLHVAGGTQDVQIPEIVYPAQLHLQTAEQPVTITSETSEDSNYNIGTLELHDGAKLGDVMGVDTLHITSNEWQANKWLTDIKTLKADGRINSLHIAKDKPALPVPDTTYPAQLHLQTAKQPVTITNGAIEASVIGSLHIHDKAELAEVRLQRVKADDGNMQGTDVVIEGTGWKSSDIVLNPLSITVGEMAEENGEGGEETVSNLTSLRHGKKVPEVINSQTMIVDFTDTEGKFNVTVHGDAGIVDFSSQDIRPPLRFIQDGGSTQEVKGNSKVNTEDVGRNDTLDIKSGMVIESSGFVNYAITGDRTAESEDDLQFNDPVSIEVGVGGKVARVALLGVSPAQTTPANGNVNVSFPDEDRSHKLRIPQTNEELPDAFIVSNTGGDITEEVNFRKTGDTASPALVFNQAGGTTQKIVGGTGKGDHLILAGGSIIDEVEGVETVDVTGSGWKGVIVNDPVKVQVHRADSVSPAQDDDSETQGGHIGLLTTQDQRTMEIADNRLQLMFAEVSTLEDSATPKEVDIVSGNRIDDIDFMDDNAGRPAIKITQNGGTIGNIAGMYKDSLHVTGSTVSGDISGLSAIRFSGSEATFGGQNINTDGTLSVGNDSGNARLKLTKGSTVNVTPANNRPTEEAVAPTKVHIEESGTLETDQEGGTHLNVSGLYQQDGTLRAKVAEQQTEEVELPVINATSIKLGEKAAVDIPNLSDSLFDSSILLMKAESEIDGAAPVIQQPGDIRYTHFSSIMAESGKEVRLNSASMGSHISGLAAQGQADAGSQRAIEVAINPKQDKVPVALDTADPLNDWTRAQCNSVNNEPVAVARIARQMKPDNSGASLSAARAGIQQSGKAISARQSARRTGISTGDMYSEKNVWIQYAYNNATQKEKDGIYGYEATTHGFTLGADAELRTSHTFGVAYTYSKGDIKGTDGSQSHFDTTGHIFSLYGTMEMADSGFVDAQLSYGRGENDGKRRIDNAGEVKAKYNTGSWYLGLLGGYPIPLDNEWNWIPQVAFNYANIETDDYQEEGSNTNANTNTLAFDKVSTSKYEIIEIGVGVKIAGDIPRDSMTFKPEASLMAYHDFKDDPVTMTAHYAAGGNSFVVHGAKRDSNRMQLGLGGEMEMNNNVSLSLNYDFNWMDTFSAHSFKIKGSYRF